MDIDVLNTFLEVSKTHHFGRAADNLFITQAAVSARIKSLESLLDVRLFERTTKQVTLTPEGERFIRHAETMVLAWRNARLDMARETASQDVIAVGATPGLWYFALNNRLAGFLDEPYYLNALSYANEDSIRLLKKQALDLAIVYESIPDSRIHSHSIGTLDLALFCKGEQPVDTRVTPYIHIDWGWSFQRFLDKQFQHGLNTVMHTDNAVTALAVVEAHGGMAYLPELLASEVAGLARVNSRKAPVFKRKVYACYASEGDKTAVIQQLARAFRL